MTISFIKREIFNSIIQHCTESVLDCFFEWIKDNYLSIWSFLVTNYYYSLTLTVGLLSILLIVYFYKKRSLKKNKNGE